MKRGAYIGSWGWLAILMIQTAAHAGGAAGSPKNEFRATLNGLEIVLDRGTGGILRMSYPGPGTMLETTAEFAGAVDLAYQTEDAEPIRLASRFSPAAEINQRDDQVVIRWDRLGNGTNGAARISATVTLEPAADGRSVILTCELENASAGVVRQVLFPDFMGLVPFAGTEDTAFRTGGTLVRPFVDLRAADPDKYATAEDGVAAYHSGGVNQRQMISRWFDVGGLIGGVSVFPKRWGYDPRATVRLQRWNRPGKLRLMVTHDVHIAPGEQWSSGPYVMTPHACGWAKGIEPYRDWVRRKIDRICSVPDHVRDDLGFRTVWMCRNQPKDPQDAVWKFRDLPRLAREARDHGLRELVVWVSHPAFELPLPPFFEHLGGDEAFVRAVAECKQLGVNVVPLISVCQAKEKTAGKYRLKGRRGGWTYHPELIPRFNPPYAKGYACIQVSTHDPVWREEVLRSCEHLIDLGISSLCWDQFFIEPPEPNLLSLTRRIRSYSRQRDPQSTFSAEELQNLEISSAYLDYTWDWEMYRDLQPVTSVYPAPRVNVNIDASPDEVKQYFLRNRYMNIQPRKPDDINGSDSIENHPELSRALKQCAKLRAQFLAYFVEGTLIGDCILTEPCREAVVTTYVMPDKALILVMNTAAEARQVRISCDVSPWLKSTSGDYQVRHYNEDGKVTGTIEWSGGKQRLAAGRLKHLEMALFEVAPR